jgi:hypothetical protein
VRFWAHIRLEFKRHWLGEPFYFSGFPSWPDGGFRVARMEVSELAGWRDGGTLLALSEKPSNRLQNDTLIPAKAVTPSPFSPCKKSNFESAILLEMLGQNGVEMTRRPGLTGSFWAGYVSFSEVAIGLWDSARRKARH